MFKDQTYREKMNKTIELFTKELSSLRTGRANASMLDLIKVDVYGQKMPINQLATISVPEPRLITLQPFEKSLIADIEKAIMDSNLGLTPNNNGNSILIPIPALSEERRKDLIKYVHQLIEDGRIAIRNVRRDTLHHLKEYGKKEHISEDEIRRQELEVQKITDNHIDSLNGIQENKEKELMEN